MKDRINFKKYRCSIGDKTIEQEAFDIEGAAEHAAEFLECQPDKDIIVVVDDGTTKTNVKVTIEYEAKAFAGGKPNEESY